jgi:hypothetical protein
MSFVDMLVGLNGRFNPGTLATSRESVVHAKRHVFLETRVSWLEIANLS